MMQSRTSLATLVRHADRAGTMPLFLRGTVRTGRHARHVCEEYYMMRLVLIVH
jgi:hypothetical protein